MNAMNILLPDSLKSFVDEQVAQHGYGTSSEYVYELIRKEAKQRHLRGLLRDGAASTAAAPADAAYFNTRRERVQKAPNKRSIAPVTSDESARKFATGEFPKVWLLCTHPPTN